MNQFNSLLKILNDELQAQKELQKLLLIEKKAIVEVKQGEVQELQKTKENLLTRIQNLLIAREGLVRNILQIEDGKKIAKASDAILKCSDIKLKKQLQALVVSLRTISEQVKEQNAYNGKMINQALGILTSSLAIVRSTPGTELPTYGVQGKLKSASTDPAFQRKKTLVTSA